MVGIKIAVRRQKGKDAIRKQTLRKTNHIRDFIMGGIKSLDVIGKND